MLFHAAHDDAAIMLITLMLLPFSSPFRFLRFSLRLFSIGFRVYALRRCYAFSLMPFRFDAVDTPLMLLPMPPLPMMLRHAAILFFSPFL